MTPATTHARLSSSAPAKRDFRSPTTCRVSGSIPASTFVVFDRGPGTGGAWQFRWEALRIGSAHRINDLPGMDELGLSFENADRTLPAKEVVADYYRQYEDHLGCGVHRPASLRSVFNRGTELSWSTTHGGELSSGCRRQRHRDLGLPLRARGIRD